MNRSATYYAMSVRFLAVVLVATLLVPVLSITGATVRDCLAGGTYLASTGCGACCGVVLSSHPVDTDCCETDDSESESTTCCVSDTMPATLPEGRNPLKTAVDPVVHSWATCPQEAVLAAQQNLAIPGSGTPRALPPDCLSFTIIRC